MPAARRTITLLGAVIVTALAFAPHSAAASACGPVGYSYAGLRAARAVHGIRAVLTPLVPAQVEGGQVTASVAVGRTTVAGKRGLLRAGLLAASGEPNRLYYEVLQEGSWRVYVGPYIQPGERHRVALLETAARRGRWRVWFDGRPVSGAFFLGRMPGGRTALAAAEAWSDGTATCESFRYRFARVAVSGRRGFWRRLYRSRVLADSGFTVVRSKRKNTFVAINPPPPPPAPAPVSPSPPPTPAPAPIEFVGDWETGDWSQWWGIQWRTGGNLADQFAVVTDPVRQGRFAARFTVRPGDKFGTTSGERCEVLWPGSAESEGDEYWYSWSTLFPVGWTEPRGWGMFLQWHSYLPAPGPVFFNARGNTAEVAVNAGPLTEAGNNGSFRVKYPLLGTLSKGLWNDFIARIRWSGTDGSIEVWHRVEGETSYLKRVDVHGIPTLHSSGGTTSENYIKLGLYREVDTKTDVIYQDGFRRWQSPQLPPELADSP